MERRGEIGLPGEALILAIGGGFGGVALGAGVTAVYASMRGWDSLIPPIAIWGGLAASLLIGVVVGLYPARRAARMAPTEALRGG